MNYKLVAYAQDFVSFLLQNVKDASKIDSITLYGSVARGEAGKDSDIDIFIETSAKIEGEISSLKERFYESIKAKKYWGLLGIKNDFHCEIGTFDQWQDIEKSLHAQGIVLFGKYSPRKGTKPSHLFSIEQSNDRNKSISLWRRLYGYTQKVSYKKYVKKGLLEEYGGEKIARGVFIVPSGHAQKMLSFLKERGVRYKIILFWKEG